MIKPILEKDSAISIKLITGEELIVRVIDFDDDRIEVSDARTVAINQQNGVGLMHTFILGGDLQRGHIMRNNITAFGVLGAEAEKKYLAEVSGLVI